MSACLLAALLIPVVCHGWWTECPGHLTFKDVAHVMNRNPSVGGHVADSAGNLTCLRYTSRGLAHRIETATNDFANGGTRLCVGDRCRSCSCACCAEEPCGLDNSSLFSLLTFSLNGTATYGDACTDAACAPKVGKLDVSAASANCAAKGVAKSNWMSGGAGSGANKVKTVDVGLYYMKAVPTTSDRECFPFDLPELPVGELAGEVLGRLGVVVSGISSSKWALKAPADSATAKDSSSADSEFKLSNYHRCDSDDLLTGGSRPQSSFAGGVGEALICPTSPSYIEARKSTFVAASDASALSASYVIEWDGFDHPPRSADVSPIFIMGRLAGPAAGGESGGGGAGGGYQWGLSADGKLLTPRRLDTTTTTTAAWSQAQATAGWAGEAPGVLVMDDGSTRMTLSNLKESISAGFAVEQWSCGNPREPGTFSHSSASFETVCLNGTNQASLLTGSDSLAGTTVVLASGVTLLGPNTVTITELDSGTAYSTLLPGMQLILQIPSDNGNVMGADFPVKEDVATVLSVVGTAMRLYSGKAQDAISTKVSQFSWLRDQLISLPGGTAVLESVAPYTSGSVPNVVGSGLHCLNITSSSPSVGINSNNSLVSTLARLVEHVTIMGSTSMGTAGTDVQHEPVVIKGVQCPSGPDSTFCLVVVARGAAKMTVVAGQSLYFLRRSLSMGRQYTGRVVSATVGGLVNDLNGLHCAPGKGSNATMRRVCSKPVPLGAIESDVTSGYSKLCTGPTEGEACPADCRSDLRYKLLPLNNLAPPAVLTSHSGAEYGGYGLNFWRPKETRKSSEWTAATSLGLLEDARVFLSQALLGTESCSWEAVEAVVGESTEGLSGGEEAQCVVCPEGRYSPQGPSRRGVYCPGACVAGKSSPAGSVDTGTELDPCFACAPGDASAFASPCQRCAAGHFSNVTGGSSTSLKGAEPAGVGCPHCGDNAPHCVGGNECSGFHTGEKCSQCLQGDQGRFMMGSSCVVCPPAGIDPYSRWWPTLLQSTALATYLVWQIRRPGRKFQECHEKKALDFIQILIIQLSIPMQGWPIAIVTVSSWANAFVNLLDVPGVTNLDCQMLGQTHFHKMLASLALPVLTAMCLAAGAALARTRTVKNRCIRYLGQCASVSYIFLVSTALAPWDCSPDYPGSPLTSLDSDPTVRCYTPDFLATYSIVGLVLGAYTLVVMPLLCYRVAAYGRENKLLEDPDYMERYGWMYLGFTREWAGYEAAVMVRKAAMVAARVFYSTAPLTMAHVMLVINFTALAFQLKWVPSVNAKGRLECAGVYRGPVDGDEEAHACRLEELEVLVMEKEWIAGGGVGLCPGTPSYAAAMEADEQSRAAKDIALAKNAPACEDEPSSAFGGGGSSWRKKKASKGGGGGGGGGGKPALAASQPGESVLLHPSAANSSRSPTRSAVQNSEALPPPVPAAADLTKSEKAAKFQAQVKEQKAAVAEQSAKFYKSHDTRIFKATAELQDLFDSDRSGSINVDEFVDVLVSRGIPSGEAPALFRKYDTDGSGELNSAELAVVVQDILLNELKGNGEAAQGGVLALTARQTGSSGGAEDYLNDGPDTESSSEEPETDSDFDDEEEDGGDEEEEEDDDVTEDDGDDTEEDEDTDSVPMLKTASGAATGKGRGKGDAAGDASAGKPEKVKAKKAKKSKAVDGAEATEEEPGVAKPKKEPKVKKVLKKDQDGADLAPGAAGGDKEASVGKKKEKKPKKDKAEKKDKGAEKGKEKGNKSNKSGTRSTSQKMTPEEREERDAAKTAAKQAREFLRAQYGPAIDSAGLTGDVDVPLDALHDFEPVLEWNPYDDDAEAERVNLLRLEAGDTVLVKTLKMVRLTKAGSAAATAGKRIAMFHACVVPKGLKEAGETQTGGGGGGGGGGRGSDGGEANLVLGTVFPDMVKNGSVLLEMLKEQRDAADSELKANSVKAVVGLIYVAPTSATMVAEGKARDGPLEPVGIFSKAAKPSVGGSDDDKFANKAVRFLGPGQAVKCTTSLPGWLQCDLGWIKERSVRPLGASGLDAKYGPMRLVDLNKPPSSQQAYKVLCDRLPVHTHPSHDSPMAVLPGSSSGGSKGTEVWMKKWDSAMRMDSAVDAQGSLWIRMRRRNGWAVFEDGSGCLQMDLDAATFIVADDDGLRIMDELDLKTASLVSTLRKNDRVTALQLISMYDGSLVVRCDSGYFTARDGNAAEPDKETGIYAPGKVYAVEDWTGQSFVVTADAAPLLLECGTVSRGGKGFELLRPRHYFNDPVGFAPKGTVVTSTDSCVDAAGRYCVRFEAGCVPENLPQDHSSRDPVVLDREEKLVSEQGCAIRLCCCRRVRRGMVKGAVKQPKRLHLPTTVPLDSQAGLWMPVASVGELHRRPKLAPRGTCINFLPFSELYYMFGRYSWFQEDPEVFQQAMRAVDGLSRHAERVPAPGSEPCVLRPCCALISVFVHILLVPAHLLGLLAQVMLGPCCSCCRRSAKLGEKVTGPITLQRVWREYRFRANYVVGRISYWLLTRRQFVNDTMDIFFVLVQTVILLVGVMLNWLRSVDEAAWSSPGLQYVFSAVTLVMVLGGFALAYFGRLSYVQRLKIGAQQYNVEGLMPLAMIHAGQAADLGLSPDAVPMTA